MEDFNAILQGLRTGRVSSAVAKAAQCHPSVTITDPSQGSNSSAYPQEWGITAWQWDVLVELQETPWATEQWTCQSTVILVLLFVQLPWQSDTHVPRGTPASVRPPGNVCYDQHWETEEVLASWKRPWEVSTKWLRNQTYPKLSMFSSSGASGHSHFPFLLCQMDVRKQRKWILNSLPAKPRSKPGESLLLCLIPACFFLLSPCSRILLIIWH